MEHFDGFGKGARKFFGDLARHNDRNWFQENRHRYEDEILRPALSFVSDLGARLKDMYDGLSFSTLRNGSGSVMRINRDIRFSPDKRPYKTNVGIIFWIGDGKKVELPCFYFHLDASQIFFYGGQHQFPKDVLERYRAAAADDRRGSALEKILGDLGNQGLPLMEEPVYKRVPRGYPADNARGDLLRLGGLGVGADIPAEMTMEGDLIHTCADYARRMAPLIDWLNPLNGLAPAAG